MEKIKIFRDSDSLSLETRVNIWIERNNIQPLSYQYAYNSVICQTTLMRYETFSVMINYYDDKDDDNEQVSD